jgi:glyoxylase-like metal-dependent hydrolase (beta-lactamase superfamily II)
MRSTTAGGTLRLALNAASSLLLAGCSPDLRALNDPPGAAAVTTSGTWYSLIYAARVDGGVIVIDLGWVGAEGRLREALARIGAKPEEVTAVFLTHSHRDHIAAWPLLRKARFHLGANEIDLFTGRAEHEGWAARAVDEVNEVRRPGRGELDFVGIAHDTAIVFGTDTVRAYPVPGHTAGSMAYLFRGTLFVGDAVGWAPVLGYGPAKPRYTDDLALSKRSVAALWKKLEGREVTRVCTAHGRCSPLTDRLKAAVGD